MRFFLVCVYVAAHEYFLGNLPCMNLFLLERFQEGFLSRKVPRNFTTDSWLKSMSSRDVDNCVGCLKPLF